MYQNSKSRGHVFFTATCFSFNTMCNIWCLWMNLALTCKFSLDSLLKRLWNFFKVYKLDTAESDIFSLKSDFQGACAFHWIHSWHLRKRNISGYISFHINCFPLKHCNKTYKVETDYLQFMTKSKFSLGLSYQKHLTKKTIQPRRCVWNRRNWQKAVSYNGFYYKTDNRFFIQIKMIFLKSKLKTFRSLVSSAKSTQVNNDKRKRKKNAFFQPHEHS